VTNFIRETNPALEVVNFTIQMSTIDEVQELVFTTWIQALKKYHIVQITQR
jgi:hypothetical protein